MVSNRNVQIEFSGALNTSFIQAALENPISVCNQVITDLGEGDNFLSVPEVTGLVCTAITIVPPSGNTVAMTLKGDPADVGIPLHVTDPSTIAIPPGSLVFYITVPATFAVNGIIFLFS